MVSVRTVPDVSPSTREENLTIESLLRVIRADFSDILL